ncbi:hypothetical protein [Rhizobium sp. FKL33]|uniref:hypothetical protein n=1 Tax=Rhizobium sp. FKL33 TaxID=2562307 RepID=UPI0010C086FA|nr:hypothetical protein [Rhizobium sp. FKL33]
MKRLCALALWTAASHFGLTSPALAHSAEGGIVLLLPTGYYIIAGCAAVAASFLLVSLLPNRWAQRLHQTTLRLPALPMPSDAQSSLLSFAILCFMVVAGLAGSPDPTLNPLPHFIWTGFWVVLVILHGVVGPLWNGLNPWTGPLLLLGKLTGRDLGARARISLPGWLGAFPAIAQFYAFAWFELVDAAPEDPRRLAVAVIAYWTVNFVAMITFGAEEWANRGEPFSIFFRLIGGLSPLGWERVSTYRRRPRLGWPGHALYAQPPLPASKVLFVLLTLSTVSFDGFSNTFLWFGAIGVNPLDFQGRSSVVLSSTSGLVASFVLFAVVYYATVALGRALAQTGSNHDIAGRMIYSILPISLAFQMSHYLTVALVGLQDLAVATSDPFALGQDWLGMKDHHVTLSFLNDFDAVRMLFSAQVAIVTLGHVVGVVMAHGMVSEQIERPEKVFRLEVPMAVLMIAFTFLGLWLLSTPRI